MLKNCLFSTLIICSLWILFLSSFNIPCWQYQKKKLINPSSSSTKSLEFKGKKSKNPAPISFTDWPGKSRDSCHINLSLPWLIFVQNMISNIPYLFLLDDDGLWNVIEGQTIYNLPPWKQLWKSKRRFISSIINMSIRDHPRICKRRGILF